MTIPEIVEAINAMKTCSKRQVQRYIATLGIKPVGARQWNQQYPADSADRILQHLGFSSGAGESRIDASQKTSKSPFKAAGSVVRAAGILSLKQLKNHKPKRTK